MLFCDGHEVTAWLIADRQLSPGVVLAPDGIRVGMRDGALVAEVGGRCILMPREPRKWLAAIAELRTPTQAPYR